MLHTNKYILIDKVINRILNYKNVIWSKISPSKVARKFLGKSACSHSRLRDLLNNNLGPISTVSIKDIPAEDKKSILFHANQTLEHKFNYLGSGWTRINPIDWHTDFISGHTWNPGEFYRKYTCINPDGGYDIKVVWELSRCHHLLWLAEAYSLTNDRKYSKEVVAEIKDWIKNNPLMYSINWTCSMDVAIRAVNWMYAVGIIIDSGDIDDEFSDLIYKSLYEHGFYIINNLEKTIPYSGNHYLSDLTGLLFISVLYPDNFFARRWFRFALKEFKREALIQISPDGTNYEHSVSYHRLVSELFIYPFALLKRLNYVLSPEVESRFKLMIDYIASYTKKSGLSPLIADNDNGRLLPFTPRDFRKHGYMCNIGNALWRKRYNNSIEAAAESLYIAAGTTTNGNADGKFEREDTQLFPDNRLAIIRDDETELYVTNSPAFLTSGSTSVGAKGGTHTHPDALSFELSFAGEDFIIDSGTYVYTSRPSLRNELRATVSHNTIVVDGLNQNGFSDRDVFTQTIHTVGHILTADEGDNRKTVTGSYHFDDFSTSFIHFRTFEVCGGVVTIKDEVSGAGEHDLCLNFHIAPGVEVDDDGKHIMLRSTKGTVEMTVSEVGNLICPKIVDSLFSPSYGVLQKSKSVRFHCTFKDKSEVTTIIQWKKK